MCYVGTYPLMQQRGRRNQGNNASQYAPALWNYEDGQRVRVVCYTNAGSARLFLNGEVVNELPQRDESTNILFWDIEYHPGTLLCEALDGELVESVVATAELTTCERPASLRATAQKAQLNGADDVIIVTVEVLDDHGKLVTLADNEITCRTQGRVRLLGMENGDIRDTRDKTQARCRVKNGRLVAYIAKGSQTRNFWNNEMVPDTDRQDHAGTARITFSSPLLKGTELQIDVQ